MAHATIILNDLLNLSGPELSQTKIRFNQSNGISDPMEEYKKDPDKVNTQWLLWRSKLRYFAVGQNAISLLRLGDDTWLLTTIKKITADLDIINGVNYTAKELDKYKVYFGRVIIKYHKTHQTQGVWANSVMSKLEVSQILPSIFDGEDFPGYDKVRLSFSQLKTIITRQKRDWIAALANQKAVYLITDTNNGKQYVGSAYGNNDMLLQRWTNYINNGNGCNKELKKLVNQNSFDYIKKYFQYSILENYNSRVDNHIILERESWWKETLGTRKFGYNGN
jgi:hypothetical protein